MVKVEKRKMGGYTLKVLLPAAAAKGRRKQRMLQNLLVANMSNCAVIMNP